MKGKETDGKCGKGARRGLEWTEEGTGEGVGKGRERERGRVGKGKGTGKGQ